MKKQGWLFWGASIVALATVVPAYAQDSEAAVEEVIVTAQRREQRIQDVPMTVSAVSGAALEEFNIFTMTDVQTLTPGLVLDGSDGRVARASLRGVTYDPDAAALAGTVGFYFNELPIDAAYAFRSLYDVGQIEVLRGPQGTLRGQPSPAGAVTITSRSPNYSEYGGSLSQSLSDASLINTQAVINIPIIQDKLAIRLAGVYDSTDGNQVRRRTHPLEQPGCEPVTRDSHDQGDSHAQKEGLHSGSGGSAVILLPDAPRDHCRGCHAEAESNREHERQHGLRQSHRRYCIRAKTGDPEHVDDGEERLHDHLENHRYGEQ